MRSVGERKNDGEERRREGREIWERGRREKRRTMTLFLLVCLCVGVGGVFHIT